MNDELNTILTGKSERGTAESSAAAGEPEYKLEDLDAVFSKPPANVSDKEISESSGAPKESIVPEAGAVGAVAGTAFGRIFKTKPPQPYVRASVEADVTKKAVARQQSNLAAARQAHVSNVDAAFLELKNAQARASDAARELTAAREAAMKLNALPEVGMTKAELQQLQEAMKFAEQNRIPIDKGAMAHNIKMKNIVDYNAVRKAIAGTAEGMQGLERLSGYTQSGRLIVPQELSTAPLLNAEQLEAQRRLQKAQEAFDAASKNATSMEARWKGLSNSTPKPVTTAEAALTRSIESAAKAADRLDAVKPTGTQRVGMVMSKIPGLNLLSGAMTAAEYANMVEQANKGNYTDATISGMSGLGGTLMLAPTAYAKVAGALLSVPPLAYQAYRYFNPAQQEERQRIPGLK